ncbi:xanthine dehydrogenase family protein molybdopterin-binding subunit [Rhizobium leguminosarum]|uniref:xanthine dehydrogenase family protein molybdopterin-binding subunit n=1 Tax=Rhizobium leguminosarum TaxID=384 RepID=UPI0013BF86CE|nr:molybdopterin cofactor-binding domain-containing protein [Rhizobium leguminosarum]NEH97722.1 molybdopterin-dependent oxidoreductase [Rhizobium leguminosarum]NEJ44461.1 molybdopterin-dependent oxidoreductase [Rhizobium leguminosarum]NEJ54142.1 molybdopterin-dependent oxidoreductase [Rhizobium leguminosarum]NEJ82405.1 molybdopterin-dependent oxidoreductase [Rhizobium leguminosarum]
MSSIEFRKDLFANERDDTLKEIGQPTIRQDILGHVTGRTPYYDDRLFDGLLHMRAVRSPHHHAQIRSIDTSAAERMPGVRRVATAKDVPVNLNTLLSLINFGRDDEPLCAHDKVRYKGEAVAWVIADTERHARDACAAVRVDYGVLPHVLDVEDALKPDAPIVNQVYPGNTFEFHDKYDHQKLRFGDVNAAFARADHVIEAEYQMSPIEQAPIETCGAIAAPEINDRFVCYTNTQALFFSLGTTAKILNIASSRLHFIGGTAGGGFGGKVDSIVEPTAVLGAMLTGRPVRFAWDRYEEMQVGAPRGAERWRLKDGVMRDGTIIAREFTGFFDNGAYMRLSPYAILKCVGHLPGPYSIPNVSANVFCCITNRTPATAMRGFGVTAVDFAIECQMDRIAEVVKMNPIELRILNAYRDGDMKAHRRKAKNTALIECCQVAAGKGKWPISSEAAAQSSLIGGGTPERVAIPETVIDNEGRIGERRAGKTASASPPTRGAGRVAAGTHGEAKVAAPVQNPDMQIDADRIGHKMGAKVVAAQPSGSASAPTAPIVRTVTPPQIYAEETSPVVTSAKVAPPVLPASAPSEPFSRGVKRPGSSPFTSGIRRR